MSNIFNYCCIRNHSERKNKMDTNGHVDSESCPLTKVSDIETNNSDNEKISDNGKNGKKNLRIKVPHPIKLKNHMSQEENFDSLHSHIEEVSNFNTKCSDKVCQSSIVAIQNRDPASRSKEEIYHDAESFLGQYYASIKRERSESHISRLREIQKELNEKGTYQLKTSELAFGAKLAWRNASRCIGRIQWKKLQIFDCREVTTARGMFEALCNHIKYATNKGNIRSAITVFPQRTDGKHDYRIWNPQLINYAGYLLDDGSILGDPMRVEFTEICIKLGWKPPEQRTAWDILPLVVSPDGKDPEFFEIPKEIIMEVHIEHPTYDWFKELGLRWYALPAISSMSLDCGGLEFPGTAFNGWYMGTEIGCRNFCDANRLNMIENVANKMGLDTNSYVSLWKDKALVEINVAVLHSYNRDNVSVVDHHSASDQFMKHLENENKNRGGCPADWIWIVPPMSSSLTAVFHQEMALYYFRPSYDYQEPAWKTHQWTEPENKPAHRKFHFKQIARAVKFTSKLFGRALSKRIKATILYATETGKSEQYARELGTIFGHAFNAQVHCMADYDMFSIEHETLLLIVASTFGNGEPPANGVDFVEHLFQMVYNEKKYHGEKIGEFSDGSLKIPTPKSLMRTNSLMSPKFEYKRQLTRLESNKSKQSSIGGSSVEHLGPLSNVCYAVFALGSSAYPKFCNYGKTVDKILYELGAERLLELNCGDELYGQEQQFRSWSSNIFHVSCDTFCLEENDMVKDARKALTTIPLTEETVRFSKASVPVPLKSGLESCFKKSLHTFKVKENKRLGDYTADRETIFISMETEDDIKYDPGDHVGIMPCNRKDLVDRVLCRVKDVENFDVPVILKVMKETLTPNGALKTWERHEKIPTASVREIFTRFVDITTPSTTVLKYLATACTAEEDSKKLRELATDSDAHDWWLHYYYPHLGECLEQFPSCKPKASTLAALLPPLQPRFYSISSTPLENPRRIELTIAIVTFKTQNGKGPTHYGVCSNYMKNSKVHDEIFLFIRRAPNFHLPKDILKPLILVGPGSGIAPFRGFWNHRRHQLKHVASKEEAGPIWLFFGCRNKAMDLYKEEKMEAVKDGVITKSLVALSREPGENKKHVQDLLEEESEQIVNMIIDDEAHFYVCGDCKMAEEVQHKLRDILKDKAQMTEQEVDSYILTLMDENRYHEDIFGITLRTAEVQNASREFAIRVRQESSQSQPSL